MAASTTDKSKTKPETKDETNFKKLVEICFFPRI